jgi:hypothetical protein
LGSKKINPSYKDLVVHQFESKLIRFTISPMLKYVRAGNLSAAIRIHWWLKSFAFQPSFATEDFCVVLMFRGSFHRPPATAPLNRQRIIFTVCL